MVAEITTTIDCALCGDPTDHSDGTGVCRTCRERMPKIGLCGKSLAVVAALMSDGVIDHEETPEAYQHLIDCADCQHAVRNLGDLATVAHMEARAANADDYFPDHEYHSYGSMAAWAEAEMAGVGA